MTEDDFRPGMLMVAASTILASVLPKDVTLLAQVTVVGLLAVFAYGLLLAAAICMADTHVDPDRRKAYGWTFDGPDLVRLLRVTFLFPLLGPLYVAFFGWMLVKWVIWITFFSWRRKDSYCKGGDNA